MTVQYEGNDEYKIFIGGKELLLSQDEINEIQGWDFVNSNDITGEVEEMEETIDIIYSNTDKLYQELASVITEIDDLLEDDEISHQGLEAQREKISVINQKLGEV